MMRPSHNLVVGEAYLRDAEGNTWIAVNPGYSLAHRDHVLRSFSRCAICALSVCATVFAVVGNVVPFACFTYPTRDGGGASPGRGTCLRVWDVGGGDAVAVYRGGTSSSSALRACAVAALLLACGAALPSALLLCYGAADEQARATEERENKLEVQDYFTQSLHSNSSDAGSSSSGSGSSKAASTPFPKTRRYGGAAPLVPPVERRERARQARERWLAAALVAAVALAAVFALVTVVLMVPPRAAAVGERRMAAGAVAYVCVLVADLCALAAAALPSVASARVCCVQPVLPCELLAVVDERGAERRRGDGAATPILLNPLSGEGGAARSAAGGRASPLSRSLRVSFSQELEITLSNAAAVQRVRAKNREEMRRLPSCAAPSRADSAPTPLWSGGMVAEELSDTDAVNM